MEELNRGIHLLAFKAFVQLYFGVIAMKNRRCRKQKMHGIDTGSQCMFGFIVLMGLGEIGSASRDFSSWRSSIKQQQSTKTIYWVLDKRFFFPSENRNPLQIFRLPVRYFASTPPILSLRSGSISVRGSSVQAKCIKVDTEPPTREEPPPPADDKMAHVCEHVWSIHSGFGSVQSSRTSSKHLSGS